MRALIADDDRTSAAILGAALRQWDFDVTTTHDGGSAWNSLQAERPPLAILDWMMPGVEGVELCRRIRENEATAHTYVILLTSRDARADRVAGLDAGADDYLIKPFDREELRARVHVGARVARMRGQLTDQVALLQEALARVKQIEGFLSVCSYCKRILSDQNSWQQMETYVAEHSSATFSHGICPACFEKASADHAG